MYGFPNSSEIEYLFKISLNETVIFLSILIFFSSIIFSVSWLSKLSNSISSSLVENDLGSRSKVLVSPIRLSWSSKNITLSKF